MNVGIIGLGAIGSVFASGLINNKNINLYIIADEKRKIKLSKGISINNKIYNFEFANDKIMDYILVTTKYNSLNSAINDMKNNVNKNTTIVSFLNGVDSELILKKTYNNQVIGGVTRISSTLVDNNYNFDIKTGRFIIGELDKSITNRVNQLSQILNESNLKTTISNDITFDLWHKFMANISENQSQALLQVPFGAYAKSENADMVRLLLAREIIELANKKGINLNESHLEFQGNVVKNIIPPQSKTSMLQDIENGRLTEIDMFAKMAVSMGKEIGLNMPINEFVYYAIKTLEDKNKGLI